MSIHVRPATIGDSRTLAALMDGFAQNHPGATHPRSIEAMNEAYLGANPISRVLLAERKGAAIGFGAWRKTYDPYWSLFGGEVMALYVEPAWRGHGLALLLIAAIAAEIKACGGCFLQGNYGDSLAPLYERMAEGRNERACHISAGEKLASGSIASEVRPEGTRTGSPGNRSGVRSARSQQSLRK